MVGPDDIYGGLEVSGRGGSRVGGGMEERCGGKRTRETCRVVTNTEKCS